MKRFYSLLVFVPITAGLMLLWPVDELFATDTTTPPPAAATVSSAVATASSAIATASSAIATASSAIATASSAIATASSAIGTDPSATAVDAIACDDDTTELCDTAADTSSATITTTTTSTATSGVTSGIAGDDDDCSKVTSALRLGHGGDDLPAVQVDDDRKGTGRSPDIVGPRRQADRFNRIVVRPRTIGLNMVEKITLTAVSMFFEKLELAVYLSLYKLKLLYTTLIAPVLGI